MAVKDKKQAGRILILGMFLILLPACKPEALLPLEPQVATPAGGGVKSPLPETSATLTPGPIPTAVVTLTATPTAARTGAHASRIPVFKHVVIFVLQNKELTTVVGNPQMPVFNQYVREYTLLEEYYAVAHPSLPNHLALISGDTFGIDTDYPKALLDAPIQPDGIEAGGRSWKAYMESMPEACGLEDTLSYVQKHNPFVFFKSIREDPQRCREHIVPLEDLTRDLQQGTLPDYVYISPNLCHSGHETTARPDQCGYRVVDHWLAGWLDSLTHYPGLMEQGLIVIDWDEGQGSHGCCGMATAGGRVAAVLVSDLVKPAFIDATPCTHYSLVRMIAESWSLMPVGKASNPELAPLISAPWK